VTRGRRVVSLQARWFATPVATPISVSDCVVVGLSAQESRDLCTTNASLELIAPAEPSAPGGKEGPVGPPDKSCQESGLTLAVSTDKETAVTSIRGHQAIQPQAIKRTILQKSDVPGTNYETVFGIAEIAPNADFASHTHPGTETGYLIEGSITHMVKGQPTREAKAGDSVLMLAGVAHSGRAGPNGAKIISAWVVEKGKPLASPTDPFTETIRSSIVR